MEWLITHEDQPTTGSTSNDSNAVQASKKDGTTSELNDKIPKEDDPNENATSMAARKKITIEEAQKLITERQALRAEEERKKAIEDEKKRRVDGQKMAETRAELQDQERIRLAQQIRREKMEKELHKKQVLEQIARDREAMRARNAPKPTSSTNSSTSSVPVSTPTKDQTKSPASECRIALRFPDGSSLVQKFSPQEQLAAVRLFVQMEKGASSGVEFVAPPNKKLTESMMNETLESLGLCPASRLEVKYNMGSWSDTD